MFNFDVYTDMAGNVRASLPSHVAHYVVVFVESGIISTVSEHHTTPTQRIDVVLTNPTDCSVTTLSNVYC